VKRAWCSIHGQEHPLVLACGTCGKAYDADGQRTCAPLCTGPSYKRWLPADQQDTWRCAA